MPAQQGKKLVGHDRQVDKDARADFRILARAYGLKPPLAGERGKGENVSAYGRVYARRRHSSKLLNLGSTARPARKKRGKDESGDIIPTLRGTSADHTLARLKRDNPELAEQVVKGELSANAAAIQAGFRHPMIQVRADDLEAALEKLRKHYGVKLIWR